LVLSGCARPHVDLNPLRPTVRASVGRWSIQGAFEGGDVRLTIDEGGEGTRGGTTVWPHTVANGSAGRLLATAERYIGTPYRYGGTSPLYGFDCSGFVQFAFGQQGVELPRTSRQQALVGREAPLLATALRPGDLMFFAGNGRGIDHVAIYVGQGRIIHASAGSGRVRYDNLDTQRGKWFLRHHVSSRRILAERGSPRVPQPHG
jgi:cell wall-associated NlpC family hydrolase